MNYDNDFVGKYYDKNTPSDTLILDSCPSRPTKLDVFFIMSTIFSLTKSNFFGNVSVFLQMTF